MDETANQADIIRRLKEAVANFNSLLREAEHAGLPIGITLPLRADTASLSIWEYVGSWENEERT